MKYLLLTVVTLVLLTSCWMLQKEVNNEEQARQALLDALTAINSHDFESYYNSLDFGTEFDSVQKQVVLSTIMQHQDWQDKRKGLVADISTISLDLVSDSVCIIFYQLTFSDSTKEVSSQKMVRCDEKWKLRMRN